MVRTKQSQSCCYVCFNFAPREIMKTRFVGHSLKPRALGTSLCSRAPNSIQESLNESSVRPNGTPVMPVLRSKSTAKKTVRNKNMVWCLKKHRPDKRKVPIGPICIRFEYKQDQDGIFLLSGRCLLLSSLMHKNTRPGSI